MLRLKIMHTCIYNIGNKDCNGALNEYIIPISLTKINHQHENWFQRRTIQIQIKENVFSIWSICILYPNKVEIYTKRIMLD